MGKIIQGALETRRQKVINQLIAYNVYKKDDKHLFELSLTELENEYKKLNSRSHPHDEFGSIKWY